VTYDHSLSVPRLRRPIWNNRRKLTTASSDAELLKTCNAGERLRHTSCGKSLLTTCSRTLGDHW
jgi:hypothetical protein